MVNGVAVKKLNIIYRKGGGYILVEVLLQEFNYVKKCKLFFLGTKLNGC